MSILRSAEDVARLADRVRAAVYPAVADLEITAWVTPEPVPFSGRTSGREVRLRPGDRWGERLFDCAWFRFAATLPPGAPGDLVARIDINGELCIVDEKGVPARGLTCVKSTYDFSLGSPAKTVYRLPRGAVQNGAVELWGDAGFNDLFGSIVGEGRIAFAQVCACREDVRSLAYDLEVLGDLIAGLAEDDALRLRVLAAVAEAENGLSDFSASAVENAARALRPLFAPVEPRPALQVSAIGHSHLDLAWLWPIRETIRKGARTFASVFYNQERYPGYLFGCSQPQLFLWMKEHYPALYAKIAEAVVSGRIELLGTFWVETDCNIPCGESFVRQTLYGSRFFREEFDTVPRFCWQPDVFGYHGQLPQILKKSGHEVFITQKLSWNLINRFPHQSFHWIGIDGTGILAHMLPEETYNSPAAPRSLRKIATEYAQKAVSTHALMAYGIGDGGGGPDAEHLERIARCGHLADLPEVVHRSVGAFLEEWVKDAERFPRWEGELYLERHQGTFTTQAGTKRNNRLCETGLREAEWAASLAEAFAGVPYPAQELDALWREVLLYQFHDILPGSSIKRVYDESAERYRIILEQIEAIARSRFEAVAPLIGGGVSELIFNALPWPREEWIRCGGEWRLARVPGMGFAPIPEAAGAVHSVSAAGGAIENEFLRVAFAEDGAIASLFDKENSREVLAPGERGNQLLVFKDDGDAWDFAVDHPKRDIWVYLRQQPQPMRLIAQTARIDGSRALMEQTYRIGESELSQTVILAAGARQVVFETRADWREAAAMLRVRFPLAVSAAQARFEIPFGSLTRVTHEDDSLAKAQIEVPAQQWVDLSGETGGAALLNDCKYGFRVKGHVLDMNLIRSVPHPGGALVNKSDTSAAAGVYTDLGPHLFRYALLPHAGKASEAALTEAARAFNAPLRIVERNAAPGKAFPETGAFIALDNTAIEIPAVKRAENGDGWILRLVNVSPHPQKVAIRTLLPFARALETDLTETGTVRRDDAGGMIALAFSGFEIKTIRLS